MQKINMTKEEAIDLFEGILAGDGDVFGRMVSHEGSSPVYPPGVEKIVSLLYKSLAQGSEYYGRGEEMARRFLSNNLFLS